MAGKKDGGRAGSVDTSTRSQSDLRGGSSGGEVELNKLLKVMIPIEETNSPEWTDQISQFRIL